MTHTGYANCRECPQHLTYGDCGIECVATIEKNLFHRLMAPDEVAAIFVEPIQGEGGYIVPPPEFHRDLRALTEKHGILFVADEVQSGMGRTGHMCAIEHWNVVPDIICLAKGIASGLPLGAIVARADIMDWPPGAHASTFGGNPVACAAAHRDDRPVEEKLMENATRQGDFLMAQLKRLQTRAPGNRRRARQRSDDRRRAGESGADSARPRRGRTVGADLFPERTAPLALRRECDADLPAARHHAGALRDGAGHHVRMPRRVGRCPGWPQQGCSDCLSAVEVAVADRRSERESTH